MIKGSIQSGAVIGNYEERSAIIGCSGNVYEDLGCQARCIIFYGGHVVMCCLQRLCWLLSRLICRRLVHGVMNIMKIQCLS